MTVPLQLGNSGRSVEVPAIVGHSGNATSALDIALQVIRRMFTGHENVRFGIGRRQNRAVSLYRGTEIIVPNIFQLSSGETPLLDLFLSILRDFDLSGSTFSNAVEIRGIAVVDEIDLHLHAVHQHENPPQLDADVSKGPIRGFYAFPVVRFGHGSDLRGRRFCPLPVASRTTSQSRGIYRIRRCVPSVHCDEQIFG